MKLNKIILLLVLTTIATFGQTEGVWKNYSSFSSLTDIAIKNNMIWGATAGGTFFYDMESGESASYTKSEGLRSQNVTAINIDGNNLPWLGTLEGYLHVIENSEVQSFNDIASLDFSNKVINTIIPHNNLLYVGTGFGCVVLDSESKLFVESYLKFGSFNANAAVFDIYVDDRIYVVTEQGLAISKSDAVNLADPASWDTFPVLFEFEFNENSRIVSYNGKLYCGTSTGFYKFENDNFTFLEFRQTEILDLKVANNKIYILLEEEFYSYDETVLSNESQLTGYTFSQFAKSDDLYAVNKTELIKDDLSKVENFLPNAPQLNSFADLAIDGSGNLWTVTGPNATVGGISMFDGTSWSNYSTSNTPVFRINAFHKAYYSDRDNKVYFSNWGRGYSTYENGEFFTYASEQIPLLGISADTNYLVLNEIRSDSDGNVWILNYDAADKAQISVLTKDNQWFKYPYTRSALAEELVVDQYGTKWFALFSSGSGFGGLGVFYFNENGTFENTNDDVWGNITTSQNLTNNNVTDLVLDDRGEIWVGTEEGITIISNPSAPTTRITSVFPMRTQSVTKIAVDPLNRKWVGTATEGVFLLSEDGTKLLENYTTENSSLPTNNIKSIIVNKKDGTVYIGTDFGLTSVTTLAVQPRSEFGDLKVYPNPYYLNRGKTVYIEGLVEESQVKIISMSGKLIRLLDATDETPGGGIAKWDGKDEDGDFVASGVYLIVAFNEESKDVAISKIAVIKN